MSVIKTYHLLTTDLASGGSDDWAKGVARAKFAYTVELGDTGKFIMVTSHETAPNGFHGRISVI